VVRKYTLDKRLNIDVCTTEYVKRWILYLRELKKRATALGERDIRSFFLDGD